MSSNDYTGQWDEEAWAWDWANDGPTDQRNTALLERYDPIPPAEVSEGLYVGTSFMPSGEQVFNYLRRGLDIIHPG